MGYDCSRCGSDVYDECHNCNQVSQMEALKAELDDAYVHIEYLLDHLGAVAGNLTLGNRNCGNGASAELVADVIRCAREGYTYSSWDELNAALDAQEETEQ